MLKLGGKIALVTGSSRGIGRMIAEHLLSSEGRVIGFSRGEPAISSENYRHFIVDVSDERAIRAAFSEIAAEFGSIQILVNNAAVLTSAHSILMPPAAAQSMVNVNLLGTHYVSREAAKLMKRDRWGRIVNIGSMAASLQPAGDSLYAATKAGVAVLANVMAKELGRWGITCNTVGVTAVESDMMEQIPRDKLEEIIRGLPIARMAQREDILNVLDFLVSERSSYITAQTIWLGGVH